MSAPAPAALSGAAVKHVQPQFTPRKLGINFLLLTVGEFAAKLLTFVAFSWLARTLGPDHYGIIEFAIAVMVFFTMPADLGLGAYGAREIARNPGHAGVLLAEIVQMRTMLSAASFCLLMAFIAVIHKSAELKLLLGLYGLSLLLSAFMLQWFFQAHDQMQWVALASIVRQVVFAGLVLLLIRAHTNVVLIGLIECASVAAVGFLSLAVVKGRMRVPLPRLNLPFRSVARHLRGGVAIGACELAWAFMWYFSTVLLGLVFDQHGYLGWFGASHRLLMAGHTFVWLYFFNLLPSLARTTTEKPPVLLRLMDRSVNFAVWSSLLVAFLGSALAGNLLTTVYGPQFLDAGGSFAVLIWMIPVAMLSGHYRYALLAYNLQDKLLYCTLASAALAVGAGFALVPAFGSIGAAWALLAANIFNLVLVYFAVRRYIMPIPFMRRLSRPLLAICIAIVLYRLFSNQGTPIACAISVGAYALVLAATSGREAISLVRSLVRSNKLNAPDLRAGVTEA